MPPRDCIFVIVDRPAIIGPAVRAFNAAAPPVEVMSVRDFEAMGDAVEENADEAMAVVLLHRDGGPERAAELCRRGARLVVCVDGDPARLPRLRALAPSGLIWFVATGPELVRAFHLAYGPAAGSA